MELRDEIAKAAYSLFEKSGWVHGKDEEHWFEAEKAVSSRMGGGSYSKDQGSDRIKRSRVVKATEEGDLAAGQTRCRE